MLILALSTKSTIFWKRKWKPMKKCRRICQFPGFKILPPPHRPQFCTMTRWEIFMTRLAVAFSMGAKRLRGLRSGYVYREVGKNVLAILHLRWCMKRTFPLCHQCQYITFLLRWNLWGMGRVTADRSLTTVSLVRPVGAVRLIVTDKVGSNTLLVVAQKISGFWATLRSLSHWGKK